MKVDFKDCTDDLTPLFEFLLGFRMLYVVSPDKNNDQSYRSIAAIRHRPKEMTCCRMRIASMERIDFLL